MARLPQPGGDKGTWGDVLNEYLSVEHNSDGSLKPGATLASYAPLSNPTFTGPVIVPTPTSPTHAVTKAYADALVASGVADATTTTKGKIQLAGDLEGTADSPKVAVGAIDNAKVSATAAITQDKIAGLTTDLAAKESPAGAQAKVDTHKNATDPHGDRSYTDAQLNLYAPLSSPTFTGSVIVPTPTNAGNAATKAFVESYADSRLASFAPLANPVFSGNVTVPNVPTIDTHAANKAYVDSHAGSGGVVDATATDKGKIKLAGDLAGTADTPLIADAVIDDANIKSGANIAQSKIANLTTDLASFAPIANPTFTGSVIVPTPTSATHAVTKAYADGLASTGVADATATVKGKLQLAGDLAGTADAPLVAAGVIDDANIASGAAIAQSKIANLATDLAAKETPAGAQTKVNSHKDATDPHGDRAYADTLVVGMPELVQGKGIGMATAAGITTLSVNQAELDTVVQKAGDTMTGNLRVDPVGDGALAAGIGILFGKPIVTLVPSTGVSATLTSLGANRLNIANAATPTDANDIPTKSYVDSIGTHLLASSATPVTITSASSDVHVYSVAAGLLKTGDVIEITLGGTMLNNSGSDVDLGIKLYIGGSNLVMVDTMAGLVTNANQRKWRSTIEVVVGSTLSSQSSSAVFHLSNGSTAGWATTGAVSVGSAATNIDQSGAHDIKTVVTFSATDAATINLVLNSATVKLHRA